ncbi:MAG: SAM-dependent chlorinase/fluorinase [Chloroflexi bacterium]|nr:SAM-dependent chlorinase/fluorinase [Chloroflexota bacterium]
MVPQAQAPLIALTTDFGADSIFAGVLKGVILSLYPAARLLDLTHTIQPQNVRQASFLLAAYRDYLPAGTIHVVVVDPGVGSERRAVAVAGPDALFVVPDNGVLSHVMARRTAARPETEGRSGLPEGWRAVVLDRPELWLHPLSGTFHGRDIFAPVAAQLALGRHLDDVGSATDWLTVLPVAGPRAWPDGSVEGEVEYVDVFGNLVTNVPVEMLPGHAVVEVGGRRILGLSRFYEASGTLAAMVGSAGTLEVAAPKASAAALLGLRVGAKVVVRPR